MEIRYKDKKIRDICENEKKAIKKYNRVIAEKLIFSIEFLKNSNSFFFIYLLLFVLQLYIISIYVIQ